MWLYLSGSDPSPIAKSTSTVRESCSAEWDSLRLPQHPYGMISLLLVEPISGERLTLYTEDFHVRTLALQDFEKAWKESKADYSMRSYDCAARLSADGSFWKMSLDLFPLVELKWSENLPRWGMTVGGALYPLLPLERHTKEIDGFCLPTCRAGHTGNITMGRLKDKNQNLERVLAERLYLPTPKTRDRDNPTQGNRDNPDLGYHILKATGKKLNVLFVEWMMAYPIGWTELEPWATQWLSLRRKRHSKS